MLAETRPCAHRLEDGAVEPEVVEREDPSGDQPICAIDEYATTPRRSGRAEGAAPIHR
jgi:hypothetical protein